MKIISVDLNQDFNEAVLTALAVLKSGGVIIYPTDTIYGLGANACDPRAIELVFKIKSRSLAKPLPIIVRSLLWAKELAFIHPKLEKVLTQIWPGPTTVILPKKQILPQIVTANQSTVGIRVPNHIFTEKLLAKFGYPLTATSANLSGEEGTGDINRIINEFKNRLWKPDLIIDAGTLPESQPSTILDLSTLQPKILRVGPTKPEFLMKLLTLNDNDKKPHPKRNPAPEKSN